MIRFLVLLPAVATTAFAASALADTRVSTFR